LLQAGTSRPGWPKSPRALAGRLRRAQTFLGTLGIEIAFGREGRLETRTITITAVGEAQPGNTLSIVSRVSDNGHVAGLSDQPAGLEQATNCTDDADGADAKYPTPSSGKKPRSKFKNLSIAIWPRALCKGQAENNQASQEGRCLRVRCTRRSCALSVFERG